jgi:hypothetical protein
MLLFAPGGIVAIVGDDSAGGKRQALTHPHIRAEFAAYARSIAEWRRGRYNDDLRDRRNLQSANGLDELARFVTDLPEDDSRLAKLSEYCMRGEAFEPGQQVHYELGRFRFFSPDVTLDGFLDLLVELAEADKGERGQFGGPQIPDDNPWDE